MKLIATSGAIALAMLTTSAFAQRGNDVTHTRIIRSADLDLSNRKDVETFNHRVNTAIFEVCGSASPTDLGGALQVIKCRHDLTAQTRVDVSHAIAIAQHNVIPAVQTADADKLALTLPPSGMQH
jgi:UrcA family protein